MIYFCLLSESANFFCISTKKSLSDCFLSIFVVFCAWSQIHIHEGDQYNGQSCKYVLQTAFTFRVDARRVEEEKGEPTSPFLARHKSDHADNHREKLVEFFQVSLGITLVKVLSVVRDLVDWVNY